MNGVALLAFFYTDPGSGTLMLQLAIMAFSSVVFYFRKTWLRLFSRKDQKSDDTQRD